MRCKILSALMSVGLLCSAMPVHAIDEDIRKDNKSDLNYIIEDDHVVITGIYGYTGANLVIPETIEDLPVTKIRKNAFYTRTSLKSVTFPDTLETIESNAFYYTGLTRIDIPANLTSIAEDAFNGVYPEVITVDENNPAYAVQENILYNKEMTEFVLIPKNITEVHIPDAMTEIPKNAFFRCEELTSVMLPEGLISIGEGAFRATGISEITIPSTVTEIKKDAFTFCPNLTSLTFAEGMKCIPSDLVTIETIYCDGDPETNQMTGWTEYTYEHHGGFLHSYALRKIYLPSTLETVEGSVFGVNAYYDHQFDVFYNGTRADWENVYISSETCEFENGGNVALLTGNMHYLPSSDVILDGDLNLDDTVSVSDFVALRKYLLNQNVLSKYEYERADLNHDGIVNIYDLCLLKQNLLAEKGENIL